MSGLVSYAYTPSRLRSVQETSEWFKFKNGANLNKTIVDLSDACANVCPNIAKAFNDVQNASKPTQYESIVLTLQKGDAIIYDGQTYELGKFLGAGDATHVFELTNMKGVIRIPMLADYVDVADESPSVAVIQSLRLSRMFEFAKKSLKELSGKKGAVSIYYSDPKGRFSIVENANGNITGREFIESIWGGKDKYTSGRIYQNIASYLKAPELLSASEKDKLHKLLNLMDKNSDIETYGPESQWFSTGSIRQYVWNEDLEDWRVIDADPK